MIIQSISIKVPHSPNSRSSQCHLSVLLEAASRAYTNRIDDMGSLPQLKIPQKVLPTHVYYEASLQVLCYASEKAYGAFVYLVSVEDNIVCSTLIYPKCKVAPIKPSPLPRLELLAIHPGAKLAPVGSEHYQN